MSGVCCYSRLLATLPSIFIRIITNRRMDLCRSLLDVISRGRRTTHLQPARSLQWLVLDHASRCALGMMPNDLPPWWVVYQQTRALGWRQVALPRWWTTCGCSCAKPKDGAGSHRRPSLIAAPCNRRPKVAVMAAIVGTPNTSSLNHQKRARPVLRAVCPQS